MIENKNQRIDPAEFLAMYQKLQRLNPRAFERVCGIIDGVSVGFDIAANQAIESNEIAS